MEPVPCKTDQLSRPNRDVTNSCRFLSGRYCYIVHVQPEADPILSAFHDTGAYLRGHFRLTSGLHSPEYLQCALVLQHPRYAEHFGQLLAEKFKAHQPSVVVSPAI